MFVPSPSDETLCRGHSGIEVRGRGANHQIDAIADFRLSQPFANPQRLLLEAKCYSPMRPVGIEVTRNALGVLRDVSEFWVSRTKISTRPRYHYQYAIFAASRYTSDAECFAYAHDLYLIQLAENQYMQPIIDALRSISHETFGVPSSDRIDVNQTVLRHVVRNVLRDEAFAVDDSDVAQQELLRVLIDRMEDGPLSAFVGACRALGGGLLAMIAQRFPVFLAPYPDIALGSLDDTYTVRIRRGEQGWSIVDHASGRPLFAFDIPPNLLRLYADDGQLTSARALDLKAEFLLTMQAYVSDRRDRQDSSLRVVTFRLDREWLDRLRERNSRR